MARSNRCVPQNSSIVQIPIEEVFKTQLKSRWQQITMSSASSPPPPQVFVPEPLFSEPPPPPKAPVNVSLSPPPPPRSPSTSTPPRLGNRNPPPPASPSGQEPTTPTMTPGFSLSPPSPSRLSTGAVVGISIGGGVFVLTLIFFLCKKKRPRDDKALPAPIGLVLGIHQSTFTYGELARATNKFSEANLLGEGGFGFVYKGILNNGNEVAVKQLKVGSAQGEKEFQAEVNIISQIHHRNLVSLVGYCIAGAQRLLVYEFVPNNTLEFHLHGKGRPTMEWSLRLKIAVSSSKGLSYLHENCNPKIIHRDIKAANILIDFKFEAKVADFGLAKIALDTNTHVSTRVMGTFGYLAPEYAASGKLTEKSDVYSFGVVLLELITGRRPVDANNVYADDSLVDWARPLLVQALEESNFEGLADIKLNNEYDREEMARMVACAAACVRYTARRRPRMDQVVRVLEGNISPSDLNQGITPGHSNVYSS